jgi:two-component system response regulator AtoC
VQREEQQPRSASESDPASSGAMVLDATTKRLLIVDDNDETRRALVRHFTACGWQVESARTFHDALTIAAGLLPDVIISELQLPDVRGYRFADDYRRAVPHALTIFAVTRIPPLIFDSARKAGFDDVFGKPIDFDVLQRCIETALQLRAG